MVICTYLINRGGNVFAQMTLSFLLIIVIKCINFIFICLVPCEKIMQYVGLLIFHVYVFSIKYRIFLDISCCLFIMHVGLRMLTLK